MSPRRLRPCLAGASFAGFCFPPEVIVLAVLQVAAANDQQPVQALGADGPNPALGVGVGLWRPDWGHQDVGVL
jgi:hypothetical protein